MTKIKSAGRFGRTLPADPITKEIRMGDFARHLQHGSRQLDDDVRTLVEDAEALLQQVAADAGEGYVQAQDRLRASIDAARRSLEHSRDSLRRTAARQGAAAMGHVREHPWQAAALGVGTGLAIAWVLHRAMRR